MSDFLANLLTTASGDAQLAVRPRAVARFEARLPVAPEPPLEVVAAELPADPALPPARGAPVRGPLPAAIAPPAPEPAAPRLSHRPAPWAAGVDGPPATPRERQLEQPAPQQELPSAGALQSPEPAAVLTPWNQPTPARPAAPLAPPEALAEAPLAASPDRPLAMESGSLQPSQRQPLGDSQLSHRRIRPAVEPTVVPPAEAHRAGLPGADTPGLAALRRPAVALLGAPPVIAPQQPPTVALPPAAPPMKGESNSAQRRAVALDPGQARTHTALAAPPEPGAHDAAPPPVPADAVAIRPADIVTGLVASPQPAPAPPEPTIRVTIGRVEVRAAAPAAPTRLPGPSGPRLSLDAYLRSRRGGGR